MPAYSVTIQGWRPATVNELMTSRFQRIRLKRRDKDFVGLYVRVRGRVPEAAGKRRVSLKLFFEPGERRPDVDAYHKSLLDALKEHRLIVDDGPLWCEITPAEYAEERRQGGRATTITLEDVFAAPPGLPESVKNA